MTFEELGAMFISKDIEISKLKGIPLVREVSRFARGFATSCGVTAAILNEKIQILATDTNKDKVEINAQNINGFDKRIKTISARALYFPLPCNLIFLWCFDCYLSIENPKNRNTSGAF